MAIEHSPNQSRQNDAIVAYLQDRSPLASSDNNERGWPSIFSGNRIPANERPWLDALKEIDAAGDDLDIVLCPSSGYVPVPTWEFEEIKDFCSGTSLVPNASISAEHRATPKAWLDDRERLSNRSRSYPDLMSANALFENLKKPVCLTSANTNQTHPNSESTLKARLTQIVA